MVAPGAAAWRRLVLRSRPIALHDPALRRPWLIVAPHPDDESLGTGSLIATILDAGGTVYVAFLTDGDGSHRGAPGWTAARLAEARAGEARRALHALGVTRPPLRLRWQDAHPMTPGAADHERTVRRLATFCRWRRIDALAVTWAGEPHCDHEAAAILAEAVAKRARLPLYEYLVWGWTCADIDARVRHRSCISIDVAHGRTRQRRAINCHRSQIGGRISGTADSFRLPRSMIELANRPRLVLLTRRVDNAT